MNNLNDLDNALDQFRLDEPFGASSDVLFNPIHAHPHHLLIADDNDLLDSLVDRLARSPSEASVGSDASGMDSDMPRTPTFSDHLWHSDSPMSSPMSTPTTSLGQDDFRLVTQSLLSPTESAVIDDLAATLSPATPRASHAMAQLDQQLPRTPSQQRLRVRSNSARSLRRTASVSSASSSARRASSPSPAASLNLHVDRNTTIEEIKAMLARPDLSQAQTRELRHKLSNRTRAARFRNKQRSKIDEKEAEVAELQGEVAELREQRDDLAIKHEQLLAEVQRLRQHVASL